MNNIMCQWHNLSLSLLIMHQDKAELICEECYVNLMESKKSEVDNIIYLKKANHCPAYLLSKSKVKYHFSQFLDNIQQFDENELKKQFTLLEKKIRLIQKTLESVVEEIKTQVQSVIQNRQEIVEQLKKVLFQITIQAINFPQFQQLIQELGQQNDDMNPDVVNQIEIKFFTYFQILQNDQIDNLNKQITKIIENKALQQSKVPQKLNQQMQEQFLKLSKEFNEQHEQFITQTSPNYERYMLKFNESKLITSNYELVLRQHIVSKLKKNIIKAEMIYLGSRDGLNSNKFWVKVNGKRNLLMVFKSNNNNTIFGAFSPCLWQQNLNNYVQDDTVSSFIFSQTNNQIFPLKPEAKQYALYCNSGYGPTFGSGHDLNIQSNFVSGSSNLGNAYQIDQQLVNQRSTILCGQIQPNIMECEIFELKFQE